MDGNRLLNHLDGNNQTGIRTGADKGSFDSRKHPSGNTDPVSNLGSQTRSAWDPVRQDGLNTLDFRIENCLRAGVVSDEPDNPGNL